MKNKNCCSRLQLSALAIVGLFYSLQATALDYTIVDLGDLGGGISFAYAINNNGQIVGNSNTSVYYDTQAYLWNGGTMTNLGAAVPPANSPVGIARAINNYGQVVGTATYVSGQYNAFLWSGGVMTDLGTLGVTDLGPFGGAGSDAYGINDNGQVVGNAVHDYSGDRHAFLWNGGVMTDLGTLGGATSVAYGINNTSQVVGWAADSNGNSRAFLWNNGSMSDLGTLGGGISVANAINNNGQVVGMAANSNSYNHAFVWINGVMTDLGTLVTSPFVPGYMFSSEARGINNNGQIVGSAAYTLTGDTHAFLWSNGAMTDLNSFLPAGSLWSLTHAEAINDAGQIVGYGYNDGNMHAFLMAPVSAVPIPAAFWLFGSGLIGLFGFMRRRK